MIAILSAFIGFCSSFIPETLRTKKDKEYELKLIDQLIEALKTGHNSRLEEIQIRADSDESKYLYQYASMQIASNTTNSNWVNSLSASVRPTIISFFYSMQP